MLNTCWHSVYGRHGPVRTGPVRDGPCLSTWPLPRRAEVPIAQEAIGIWIGGG